MTVTPPDGGGLTLLTPERTADVLRRLRRLPALPDVVTRVLALTANPHSGAGDFESVIRTDPTLTTDLLRLANSAFFGLGREVVTVRQAVTVLGTKRVFDLVAGLSFAAVLPARLPGYDIDARAFWRHCVAVAVLSESLAAALGQARPDLLFTAGLLHDVGKLVIGAFLDEEKEALDRRLYDDGLTLPEAERALLGADHPAVGEVAAVRWSLPGTIRATIRWHHAPDDLPDDLVRGPERLVVDTVHAADALAHSLGLGADVAGLARKVQPSVAERLGLSVDLLESVASSALEPIDALTDAVLPSPGSHP